MKSLAMVHYMMLVLLFRQGHSGLLAVRWYDGDCSVGDYCYGSSWTGEKQVEEYGQRSNI